MPPTGGWTSACGDQNVGLTHRSGAHPPPTGGGSPCTVGRGGFPHRYKPSSLLRPYIADTSALPMLELGSMPVVTTMVQPGVTGLKRGHRKPDLLFKSFLKGVNRYQVAAKEGQQSARCRGCYPQRQAFKIETKQEKYKHFKK